MVAASSSTRDVGRMDPLGQGVEVEAGRAGDDDLPVEHATVGQVGPQRVHQLGEVPGQRLLVAAAQHDVVAVPEDDAAEPVPLGLVEQAVALGELPGQLGQHRGDRGDDGERHRLDGTRPGRGGRSGCVAGRPGQELVHRQGVHDPLRRAPPPGRPARSRCAATRADPARGRRCRRPRRSRGTRARASRGSGRVEALGPGVDLDRGAGGRRRRAKTASASKVDWGRPLPGQDAGRCSARGCRCAGSRRPAACAWSWPARPSGAWSGRWPRPRRAAASSSSSWSSEPSSRMSTSMPVRIRNGASSSFRSATIVELMAQPLGVEPVGDGRAGGCGR